LKFEIFIFSIFLNVRSKPKIIRFKLHSKNWIEILNHVDWMIN